MVFVRFVAVAFLFLAAALPARADCAAEIGAILSDFQKMGPYHLKSTTTANGTPLAMEGKVILPDSFDITMPQGRMVMTKNGVWMATGGNLQKMPDEMRESMKGMISQGMAMGLTNIKSAECLGDQSYEGGSYTAYKYDGSGTFMGIESKSAVTMYVDGNKHPAWLVIDGEAMGTKSLTVQQLTFDPGITIADPN